MNILHLHWKFNIGGSETHLFELALMQKKMNLHPIIVCTYLKNKNYIEQFDRHGIPIYEVDKEKEIENLINNHKIDIIHAHSSSIYSEAVSIGKKTNKPVVATLHGINAIDKPGATEMDEYIAVSKEIYDKVRANHPSLSVTIIENAINQEVFKPEVKNILPTIAYVGRVDSTKINGVICLHEAVRALKQRVDFVSVSTLREERFRKVRGKLVRSIIDASKILNKTDIVIGTGRAIREGMSAGNVGIVLGKCYDGIVKPDNVESLKYSNFSGRTSNTPPDTEHIVKDIKELIDNPVKFEELREWSYRYAKEHFGMKISIEKHMDVYNKLLNSNSYWGPFFL